MVAVLLLLLTVLSLSVTNALNCQLPNCRQYDDPNPPGGLPLATIPQIVMVSFYGTINSYLITFYNAILGGIWNPNGCPARGTFFIDDKGTDFKLVKSLYDQGHEIGLRSVDGSVPQTTTDWIKSLKTLCTDLSKNGINVTNVHGVRAPQLAMGDDQEMIGFGYATCSLLYDSSCANVASSSRETLLWPFTFDQMPTKQCDIGKAPVSPFPGKWEVMIGDLHDIDGIPCATPEACRNINSSSDAFYLLYRAFIDHYGNRTPFNLIIDPAWAVNSNKRAGTISFLQYIRSAYWKKVWFVPIYKGLQWVQNPTPIAYLNYFGPWKC